MNYYIGEAQSKSPYLQNTAGTKARVDINYIFEREIGNPIFLELPSGVSAPKSFIQKIKKQFAVLKIWKRATQNLQAGDRLFIQFPFLVYSMFLAKLFKKLKKRGVELVFLVHDFTWLREASKTLMRKSHMRKERAQFFCADKFIVHNKKMAAYLLAGGIHQNRLIELQIFDYLIPDFDEDKIANRGNDKSRPVMIAGNLAPHKAQYAYRLPDSWQWHLYGPHYTGEEKEFIHHRGSFPPEELPYALDGSFGLVWDGDSTETCTGITGEYLKLNNPHKTSLYLASGVPVVIWKEAALADFILKNGCGIAVSSLSEIASAVNALSGEQYAQMRRNASEIGKKLREGYFTKAAIQKVVQ